MRFRPLVSSTPGPPGLVVRGNYSSGATYAVGDAVFNPADGSTYVCILGTTGNQPPNVTYWQAVAQGAPSNLAPPVSGEETVAGTMCNSSITLTSQLLVLSYFVATKTETISKVYAAVQGTAAVGGTLGRFGIWSVNPADGSLTALLAASPNVATSFNSANQDANASGTRTGGALSSAFSKVAGTLYAAGVLWVGSGAAPVIVAALIKSGFGDGGRIPPHARQVAAQADLPSTVAAGSLANCPWQSFLNLTP